MDVMDDSDRDAYGIAAAIGEPARARMLYCLMDGRARTSTELALVANVSASTASGHLKRLKTEHLIKVLIQGKHHYYSLGGPDVAAALEGLRVLAGAERQRFGPSPSSPLRVARTCYDHIAGTLGVSLHERFRALGWLLGGSRAGDPYRLNAAGARAFEDLGIDVEATFALRRRFAYDCLDWSERRPHLGGALGAAILSVALKKGWVVQDLESRALRVTSRGRRNMLTRFGLSWPAHTPPQT